MGKLGSRTTAISALQGQDLTGKVAVVTGGNSGIGVETVRALYYGGAKAVLCSRNVENGEKVAQQIREETPGKGAIDVMCLDLADLDSVRTFAKKFLGLYDRLDYLILNAGVISPTLQHTKQGFELQIGTNHVGHFLLTQELLPFMKQQSQPSRVVVLSSEAMRLVKGVDLTDLNWQRRKYTSFGVYSETKLCNALFALELNRRLQGTRVEAFSLHPGAIMTGLGRSFNPWMLAAIKYTFGWFFKSPEQGASTTIVAAVSPELSGKGGSYLSDCRVVATPNKTALDAELAKQLWEVTEALIASPPVGL